VSTISPSPNPGQQQAIGHGAGPLRILAGAGSGKTTTLCYRIGSLVEHGLCKADQILVLTFTTKAVEQLRQKVAELLGSEGEQPRVETYHAFALSLVREFADLLGLPPDPVVTTRDLPAMWRSAAAAALTMAAGVAACFLGSDRRR
jgi:DNA helicase-2/ATP-dependent DNA helicase PcrA